MMDLVNNAECGSSNDLMKLTKQFDKDPSLHQDCFEDNLGQSTLISQDTPIAPDIARERELADNFFGQHHAPDSIFDIYNFRDMRQELLALSPPAQTHDWAVDFAKYHDSISHLYEPTGLNENHDIESLFQQAHAGGSWGDDFAQFDHEHSVLTHECAEADFEKAFEQGQASTWEKEFPEQSSSWANEFVAKNEEVSVDSKVALSQTAGILLNIVSTSSNPKFKQSKFMNFMKKLRDQEIAIEGNKVVEQTVPEAGEAWGWEFELEHGKGWGEEIFPAGSLALSTTDGWTHEFKHTRAAPKSRTDAGLAKL